MIRWMALGVLVVGLGACGQPVNGNSSYVTVSNAWNDGDALESAQAHCAKYGKVPRFSAQRQYRVTFDCVRG